MLLPAPLLQARGQNAAVRVLCLMAVMVNEEIARIFERMARVLAFRGKDRFRIIAYERAAVSLRDLEQDLASIAAQGKLRDIPGIGEDLEAMIAEYLKTGRIRRYEQECRGIQPQLIDLMSIPGLGPKTLALLHQKARVNSLEDLKRSLDSEAVAKLKGFGPKKVENLKRGIGLWSASQQRMLLGVAFPLAEDLLHQIRANKRIEQADVAGSLRRRRETIGDLDILITSKDSAAVLRELTRLPIVKETLEIGETKAAVMIEGGIHVDIRAVDPESYGAALQYFTGSKQHNIHLRRLAHERGLKFNEYGIFRGTKRTGGRLEPEIYSSLDMPMMPPELREDRGEIEAAQAGKLPKLIEVDDLRGDLHTHTTYSDGKSTLEEMVGHAAELGYEYIALTDHSPSERVARGLDVGRLEEKIDEIERLRSKRKNRPPRILLGAEVDILPNGKLDYPDEILARLDVVVAAIHSGFRESRDQITGRFLDAIANPHVDILAHLTSRLLGTRDPLEFDFERILAAAVKARVALEINAQMYRLDLNDVMAKAAMEAGALLAIDSDAHSTAQMDQIRYGVFQARRGWVEAPSVVNTWSWKKLDGWLKR
ncbi:MAG TPA: DNA polymerase/3'-5' exonuclease PolX [Bryobacteraceae bacterium]|nr:DNA polymerase/3'-5' exonuclease PolX [Bryobacteraceae bacterium]